MNNTLDNSVEVKIKYGHLKQVIDWCQINCQGDYRFYQSDHQDTSSADYIYGFLFDNETDQLKFILRWTS